MKNKTLQTLKYILFDAVSAATAWTLFFYYRSVSVENGVFVFSETYILFVNVKSLSLPMAQKYGNVNELPRFLELSKDGTRNPDLLFTDGSGCDNFGL